MKQRLYLITKTGMVVDPDKSAEIIQGIEAGNKFAYTFYQNGAPVYIAIQNGKIHPLVFPQPGPEQSNYGATSPELYAKAVTYAETVSRIIQIQTKAKPSLMDQVKKVMTLVTPIIALAFIIFIMAVGLRG